MMRMVNTSTKHAKYADLKIDCAAGAFCEVEDGYVLAGIAANGSRLPSIIEKLCPALAPADEKEREEWLKVPTLQKILKVTKQFPTIAQLVAQGNSRGVAQEMLNKLKSGEPPDAVDEDDVLKDSRPARPKRSPLPIDGML